MEQLSDYSEEFEAVTETASLDSTEETVNPLNEFATDLSLSEVERIKAYSFSEILLQRYDFIKEIKRCCENGDFEGIKTNIVPILNDLSDDRDNSVRTVVLNQFEYIAKLYFSHSYDSGVSLLTEVFFPIIRDKLMDSSEVVQKAALAAFVSCCSYIKREDQGICTFSFILEFSQSSLKDHRIIAGKLFHDAAPIIGSEVMYQFGISELQLLANDPLCQVRKYAILAFGPVSKLLDAQDVENGFYQLLMVNADSPSWVVRRACAIVIPEVFCNVKSHKTFLNITRQIGELFRDDNTWVKQAMLQTLGHLISIIPEHFNINDDIKTKYMQLGNAKDDLPNFLFSRSCAFYFPAVLHTLLNSNGNWNDMNELYNRLSRHNDPIVRRSLAYSMHEMAKIIGTKYTEKYLLTIQSRFLSDKEDIQMGIILHLSEFWEVLSDEERTNQATNLITIVKQLKEGRQWRLLVEITKQLPKLAVLLEKEVALETITPIFMLLLTYPVEKVREEMSKATYVILNIAIEADHRKGLLYLFQIISFAKANKYKTRELFILCCPQFIQLLASNTFKALIRPVILILAKDRVPCVREQIVTMILNEPKKRIRRLYGFKKVVTLLSNETDSEICRILSRHPLTKDIWKQTRNNPVKEPSKIVEDMTQPSMLSLSPANINSINIVDNVDNTVDTVDNVDNTVDTVENVDNTVDTVENVDNTVENVDNVDNTVDNTTNSTVDNTTNPTIDNTNTNSTADNITTTTADNTITKPTMDIIINTNTNTITSSDFSESTSSCTDYYCLFITNNNNKLFTYIVP